MARLYGDWLHRNAKHATLRDAVTWNDFNGNENQDTHKDAPLLSPNLLRFSAEDKAADYHARKERLPVADGGEKGQGPGQTKAYLNVILGRHRLATPLGC